MLDDLKHLQNNFFKSKTSRDIASILFMPE